MNGEIKDYLYDFHFRSIFYSPFFLKRHLYNQIFLYQNSSADLSEYSESVEWELLGVPGEFHSVEYKCCPNPYDDVTYSVQIKRRALYYAMYLIIPCALIAVLTLLVFLLPPDCNERMTVGMMRTLCEVIYIS